MAWAARERPPQQKNPTFPPAQAELNTGSVRRFALNLLQGDSWLYHSPACFPHPR